MDEEEEKQIKEHQETLLKISMQSGVSLLKEYYRATYSECWKCNEDILLFTWPGCRNENEEITPKEPRPKTVQYRYSKTAGINYWSNTCPYCESLQGEFFLYSEPDSPLFGFTCGDDSIESYKADIKTLALQCNGWW